MKAVAPWVRTRLRAAPGPALALLVLVLLTSFLAAAFPRAVDAYEGEGLRHEVNAAPADRRVLQFTDEPEDEFAESAESAEGGADDSLQPERMAKAYRQILATLPEPLRVDAGQSAYGVRSVEPVRASDRWLPELEAGLPAFTLSTQAGVAEHSRLLSGRLPRAAGDGATVEGAVTATTAETLRIKVGSTVHAGPIAVRVTGIVQPLRPELGYWSYEPVLRTPALLYTGQPVPVAYWHGALLLDPGSAEALRALEDEPEPYWRIAPDLAGLTIGDLPQLRRTVASVESGPLRTRLRDGISPTLDAGTSLDEVLIGFDDIRAAIGPVVAVAAFGAGSVAVVVLLMAGGLSATRRHQELALLRSRGGSLRGLFGRLLAESVVVALPAAAGGCALALELLPHGRLLPALLASGAVALLACAALPLRAVFTHRTTRLHGGRDDVVRAKPSRRRLVAEVTLLVLAVAAVVTLRRRGTAPGEADELVSAAPVLVGIVAALVLVRLYPLPIRLLALPVARRRGAVGFLSLARAGRSPATTALPLLALLVALTTAAFGGSVLAGVDGARDRAALVSVGADARIAAMDALPKGLAQKVRKVPGVRDVVSLHLEPELDLRDSVTRSVTLVAAEPTAYARLARDTGLGEFAAGRLRQDSGALPALVTPDVAERLGSGEALIGPAGAMLTVRVAGVLTTTPAVPTGDFVLVDAARLPDRAPTALLVSGPDLSAPGLRTAVRSAGGDPTVALRSVERAGFTESPVQSGAERIYTVAAATGAGYAVLALLLSLLQAAPERTALLARLRTMGLTRGQSRRLLILESLPSTVLAAAGGALVGWTAIRLLAPGIDLGRLALAMQDGFATMGPVGLRPDPWSLLLPALAVVVIAAVVSAVQAWVAIRRMTTTELRVGDTR
ncbi:FtsX-like permease family protein [Streptomyces albipurpureus]|uniref:FtsX-like permease family protein n=1 Tax=Streptomyces albipurpureus TaxID=2897419 RepID=UPI0027E564B6|nr:FtsX-like permease family protein [Streptomyces sp. CWNU-1]